MTKDTGASVFQTKRSLETFFRRSPKEENKKGLRKFSARFLAFFYIILKAVNHPANSGGLQ